jgi:hypothetical protein
MLFGLSFADKKMADNIMNNSGQEMAISSRASVNRRKQIKDTTACRRRFTPGFADVILLFVK